MASVKNGFFYVQGPPALSAHSLNSLGQERNLSGFRCGPSQPCPPAWDHWLKPHLCYHYREKAHPQPRVEALAPGGLKYHLPSEQRPHITPAPLELCVIRKEPHTGDQGSNLIHHVLSGGAFFPSSSSGKHHPTAKGFCRDQSL